MFRKTFTLVVLIALILTLTSCGATGNAHLTIKRNGSVELATDIRVDQRLVELAGKQAEEEMRSRLKKSGIELETIEEGDATRYRFAKTFRTMESMQESFPDGGLLRTESRIQDRFLFTRYEYRIQPELDQELTTFMNTAGAGLLTQSLAKLALKGASLDFQLTLPFNLIESHNADRQDGRTLTWNVKLIDSKPLHIVILVPNLRNDLIVLVILFAGIGAGGYSWRRARKRRNREV
ncbi:hypothetical protein [Gorillibacterium sp. CAU 1737]|uniref:hypothetical protein n=1 Tax=Gorillibacterium sp. CAU 1737 TaxID=3140362 RepID=UPI003260516A